MKIKSTYILLTISYKESTTPLGVETKLYTDLVRTYFQIQEFGPLGSFNYCSFILLHFYNTINPVKIIEVKSVLTKFEL